MKDFIFNIGTRINFGSMNIEDIPKEVKRFGGSRVLLCYGKNSIKKSGLYDHICNGLRENNIEVFDLGGIDPNPRINYVREGVKIARENNCDFVLAVGGGSVIDCAKVIAAAFYAESDPWNIVIKTEKIVDALPLGAVLTLSATGSEMDNTAVITNLETKEKLAIASPKMLPKFAIMNPEITFSLPEKQTSAGVADIISHTLESYFTTFNGEYFQDRVAEAILKTCVKYGPIALSEPNDYEARANIMWASSWAINGLISTGKTTGWTVHPMEHELSAYYDINHGQGLAILTPRYLKYILNEETAEKIAELGYSVFNIEKTDSVEDDALSAINALAKFFYEDMKIPSTLGEVGVGEEHLKEMAEAAIKNSGISKNVYVKLSAEDVEEIYKMSLKDWK